MNALQISLLTVGLVIASGLAGCKKGGGGGGSAAPAAPSSPASCIDVAGDWAIDESSSSAVCGDETDSYTLHVQQTDCSLVVSSPAGMFSGSIDDRTITWSGSFPEDGGTVTINSLTVTVSADGMSLDGTSSWSWTDGVDSCTGTTQIYGVRL